MHHRRKHSAKKDRYRILWGEGKERSNKSHFEKRNKDCAWKGEDRKGEHDQMSFIFRRFGGGRGSRRKWMERKKRYSASRSLKKAYLLLQQNLKETAGLCRAD